MLYIAAAGNFSPPAQPRFIHMDIHPWNWMARNDQGQWTLSGLLDFGDALIGHCDLFELLTALIFMAQGPPLLAKALPEKLTVYATATMRRTCGAGAWPPH